MASLGTVNSGIWYTVEVSSLITADGIYMLRVSSTSTNYRYIGQRNEAEFGLNSYVTSFYDQNGADHKLMAVRDR